jgi:hypothetical protein
MLCLCALAASVRSRLWAPEVVIARQSHLSIRAMLVPPSQCKFDGKPMTARLPSEGAEPSTANERDGGAQHRDRCALQYDRPGAKKWDG